MPQINKVNIIANLFTTFAYESITVSTTVVTLTSATYGDNVKRAIIKVEDAQLRYRMDSGNPTSSEGMLMNPMDVLIITGKINIENFKAIRKGSSNSKIFISYEG